MVEEEKRKRSEKKEERGETRDPGADARPRGSTRGAGEGPLHLLAPFFFSRHAMREARSERETRKSKKLARTKSCEPSLVLAPSLRASGGLGAFLVRAARERRPEGPSYLLPTIFLAGVFLQHTFPPIGIWVFSPRSL